jgi:hypothetical protein
MTLAVARIVGNRIAVVADTLVTEHDMPLPLSKSVIKSCLLPGDLCVTFCNSPESAARDFARFSKSYPQGASFAEAVSFFEHSSVATGNDYLLAFSRSPRITKIANGRRVETAAKTLWIGDAHAFRRFRAVEQKDASRATAGRAVNVVMFMDEIDQSPASDLYSVMREVAADRGVPAVGGFISVVSNRDPGFRHSVYSDLLFRADSGHV